MATGGTFSIGNALIVVVDGEDAIVDGERVHVRRVARDELRTTIESAWRRHAPKRCQAVHDKARSSRADPLTLDAIRELATSFPAVTERIKVRRNGDQSIHWEAGKTMFVKFGEASNLLAPDIDDVVMIRRCSERAALVAASPDRFFTTTHYGDRLEPGPVLTRLSENTARDFPELAELFEASWRDVAPERITAGYTAPR